MGRVVHFEIHASDPERAVAFYKGLFGWEAKPLPDMSYWLLTTGTEPPGIDGAVLRRIGDPPAAGAPIMGACVTVHVDDLEATLAKAFATGGQLALETMPVPGVGLLAYILDTEGNVLGVLQPEAPAA